MVFNKENLRAWAKTRETSDDPVISILREIACKAYEQEFSEQKNADLISEIVNFLMSGVETPVEKLTEDELLEHLVAKVLRTWDFNDIEEFEEWFN